MRKTKKQHGAGTSTQDNERDARIDRLTDLVKRLLERDLRRDLGTQNPPSPQPPSKPEGNDSISERFQKLKPPTFEGEADPKVLEN